ncbi:hypothetical protein PENTCL1PPCAC_21595, partial [Pristionchus entomophagus]
DEATNVVAEKCQEIQGNPIIIHNSEHQSYWASQTPSPNSPLGLRCNTGTKQWEWTDGSALDFKPPFYHS